MYVYQQFIALHQYYVVFCTVMLFSILLMYSRNSFFFFFFFFFEFSAYRGESDDSVETR
jgi:hypothetical protein